jgi:hypothetical protein
MLNQKFAQAYAIAKAIPHCSTKEIKRKAILKWCEVVKKAIG